MVPAQRGRESYCASEHYGATRRGVPRVRDVRMSMMMNLTGMPLGILIEMDW